MGIANKWPLEDIQSREQDLPGKWIENADNVKDIKESLNKLKSNIFDKVKNSDKNNDYLGKKLIDNEDSFNKNLDQQFSMIDLSADNLFDKFAGNHKDELNNIISTPDNVEAKKLLKNLEIKFEDYIFNSPALKDVLAELKTITGDSVRFELNDLRSQIEWSGEWSSSWSNPKELASLSNIQEEKEKYNPTLDHLESYPSWDFAAVNKNQKIENIYTDNRLRKTMERIFDDEEGKEIRKGTFKINLDKENGLAGIIIAIRESEKYKDLTDENDLNYKYKEIYDIIWDKDLFNETDLSVLKTNIKTLIRGDKKLITYTREWWLDLEANKIAKIFQRAQRKDLDTFASLIQSKSDVAMAVKEWNNALEITGQNGEYWKDKQTSLITEKNVLNFLCDFNGDGTLSAEYKRKNNKEQKNQGDVGTLFWQQVMFTIDQAIAVKDAELGKWKGEQLVISNIIKNMQMSDSRILSPEQQEFFTAMNTSENCTKANLTKLINGYKKDEDTFIPGIPEMKIFFLDSIKKINGWSEKVQPDLYDTLVGDESEIIIDIDKDKAQIKASLDERLNKVQELDLEEQKELRNLIKTEGIVRVRETIFTNIMRAMDYVQITTSTGAKTNFQSAGVSKSRELHKARKEILEETTRALIGGGIHFDPINWLRLTVGVGKNWVSESGKTKRNRWAETGVKIWFTWPELYVWVSAEIAEQYNHGNVINANLSQVRSAKYLGLEWWAGAGISITNGTGIEVFGGINRQRDPEIWINQLNKQYEAVSEEIFDIGGMDEDKISNKLEFTSYIEDRINNYTGGKYKKFIETNKQHLTDNLNFIVKYMDANKFFGTGWKIDKLPNNKKIAINALIDIMESGELASRRNDVISGLHGKIELTKLSFGVTTNALTFKHKEKAQAAPTAWATSGETTSPGDLWTWGNSGTWDSESDLGQEKFGIAGLYIWARISTWRNIYVPNDEQYLYTQYEIGQGITKNNVENKEYNLNRYANYLQALYNDKRLNCRPDNASNKIIITFSPEKGSATYLKDFLNLHATAAAENNFSLKDNVLTIGNVREIWAYTVTEAKGVRRILSLGTKKLDDTYRVTENTENASVNSITDTVQWNKERTNTKIQSDIINKMAATETIKTETNSFFDKNGALVSPTGTTTTFETKNLEGQKLKTWILTITKKSDWTYTIKLDTSSTDTLTISYMDENTYNEARKTAEAISTNREKTTNTINKLFDFDNESELYKAQKMLDKVSDNIKDLEKNTDKKNKPEYYKFLSSASNVLHGDTIDEEEIKNAIWYLEILLPDTSTEFVELHWYLESKDFYTKSYIVDRLKQIFAKDADYTWKQVSYILNRHTSTAWEGLTGPSEEKMPTALIKELRTQRAIRAKGTETYSETPTTNPNIIWYTAFYRYGAWEEYKNVKFSMTSLGNTTHQLETHTITEHADEAKQWFLQNLGKNQYEVEEFAISLEKQCKKLGAEVIIHDKDYSKTLANITNLINWNTLDSSKKIIIDIDPVFYLLGDCCNESIGLEIKKINIFTFKDTTSVTTNEWVTTVPIPWKYTATGTADKEYVSGVQLYAKSHSIASKPISEEERVGFTHHVSKTTMPRAHGTAGETATWWSTTDGSVPNSWTGENE